MISIYDEPSRYEVMDLVHENDKEDIRRLHLDQKFECAEQM